MRCVMVLENRMCNDVLETETRTRALPCSIFIMESFGGSTPPLECLHKLLKTLVT